MFTVEEDYYLPNDPNVPETMYRIPANVKIGSATASYQIEGAWNEGGMKYVSLFSKIRHNVIYYDIHYTL